MSATSLFLVVLVGIFLGNLALYAIMIRAGLHWAQVAEVSLLKGLGFYFLFLLATLIMVVGIEVAFAVLTIDSSALDPFAYVIQFIVPTLVFARFYRVSLLRAAKASIPFCVASGVLMLFVFFILRPFAYEAYVISSNSMAPTLLGAHLETPCPKCGEPAYGTPPTPEFPADHQSTLMICGAEHQSVHVLNAPSLVHEADRMLACKFLKPKRWDLLVFRYPEQPSVAYVMRLVGLPNEELSIHDGAVWINGEKLDPPASLRGIQYSPTIEMNGHAFAGPGSEPVKLGSDEYFVLGDFPDQSSDSRFWQQGAPGQPPYAVPGSYIIGVAINIYWPPNRWTSFR